MCKLLIQQIELFQKNSDGFMDIVEPFTSKIKYLTYKLNYPEASTDLTIFLFEITKTLNLIKFNEDNELLNYLKKCLDNKAIKLSYKINKDKSLLVFNDQTEIVDENFHSDEFSNVIFNDMISVLKSKQKKIMYYKFYLQFSDCEIAEIMKISRQAVNKSKRLALNEIKYQLLKGEKKYG